VHKHKCFQLKPVTHKLKFEFNCLVIPDHGYVMNHKIWIGGSNFGISSDTIAIHTYRGKIWVRGIHIDPCSTFFDVRA
jgi:hypothetical protein